MALRKDEELIIIRRELMSSGKISILKYILVVVLWCIIVGVIGYAFGGIIDAVLCILVLITAAIILGFICLDRK